MSAFFQRSREQGFSYVGLLLLVGILGAMFAATVTAGALMQRRAAEEELLFIGKQFRNAFKSYYESTPQGSNPYPRQLSDLLLDPRSSILRRHLRQIFVDPLTGNDEWSTVSAPGGGLMGVCSLSQGTPIKVAGFDPEFEHWSNKSRYSEWCIEYLPETAPIRYSPHF